MEGDDEETGEVVSIQADEKAMPWVLTQKNERRKSCFVTRAMASIHISTGMQSTAVKPGVKSTRPRHVLWPKNDVGSWHTNHHVNDQEHRLPDMGGAHGRGSTSRGGRTHGGRSTSDREGMELPWHVFAVHHESTASSSQECPTSPLRAV